MHKVEPPLRSVCFGVAPAITDVSTGALGDAAMSLSYISLVTYQTFAAECFVTIEAKKGAATTTTLGIRYDVLRYAGGGCG